MVRFHSNCMWPAALAALLANFLCAAEVTLVKSGQAPLPVMIAAGASDQTQAAASELAGYLSLTSGAAFEVRAGEAAGDGIVVGTIAQFPDFEKDLSAQGFAAEEQYLIRSHERGLQLIGRSDIAVENAVWDLLARLGVRQFFPGQTWEVIPHTPELRIDVDVIEQPDYALRQIWPGWGTWPENDAELKQWDRRNRAHGAFVLNTGHAYEFIVPHYKAVFDEHSEYYALVDGKRTGDKMCISNPAVRKLVVEYSLQYLKDHPREHSVSVEPSDGGGGFTGRRREGPCEGHLIGQGIEPQRRGGHEAGRQNAECGVRNAGMNSALKACEPRRARRGAETATARDRTRSEGGTKRRRRIIF